MLYLIRVASIGFVLPTRDSGVRDSGFAEKCGIRVRVFLRIPGPESRLPREFRLSSFHFPFSGSFPASRVCFFDRFRSKALTGFVLGLFSVALQF